MQFATLENLHHRQLPAANRTEEFSTSTLETPPVSSKWTAVNLMADFSPLCHVGTPQEIAGLIFRDYENPLVFP